jgi:NAD(P)-dependent dehydrogenase (short-subunit alcohol dehydrogenase family)
MDVSLKGKRLLVTGGTQGVGASIALLAGESGAAAIVITGRSEARGEEMANSVARAGVKTSFVAADLAESAAPGHVIEAAVAQMGGIDLLANAAGHTNRASVVDGGLDDWETLFAVNARAPFFLMQGAIRDMIGRREAGAIVNILSMNAHCGTPDLAIYSATKGALATLTRNAANAHLADRIRVNGINMGWAATPGENVMQGEILGKGSGWAAEAAVGLPLGRLLTQAEVAQLAVFLLSEQAGLLTGALIDLEQTVLGAPKAGKAGNGR